MAKKTEPWPLLQDIVPAPRSPGTSKVLNFAAIVYKKRRESCFFARSRFLWIKPVEACFKTNWFCFSFQLETYIKPVGFASQNQLVWGWSWAKVRQFDACKGLPIYYDKRIHSPHSSSIFGLLNFIIPASGVNVISPKKISSCM